MFTPKYNGNIEGGLSSKRYNKTARCFNSVFKEETEVFWYFRGSIEKPHNTCTTQLIISIIFEISHCVESSEQNSKKRTLLLLVWPSVFDTVLICFFEELPPFFGAIWCCLTYLYLNWQMKKPWYLSHRKVKWGLTNSLKSLTFLFVCILMHRNEEWVLLQLDS